MMNFIARTARSPLRLGGIGMLLGTLAVVTVTIVAAGGQAVGPVLSGAISGSTGLTVEQAITLDMTIISSAGTLGSATRTPPLARLTSPMTV